MEKLIRCWETTVTRPVKNISRNTKVARNCLTTNSAPSPNRQKGIVSQMFYKLQINSIKTLSFAAQFCSGRLIPSYRATGDWTCWTVITSTSQTYRSNNNNKHGCVYIDVWKLVWWLGPDYEGLWAGWRRSWSLCPKLTVSAPLIQHRRCTVLSLSAWGPRLSSWAISASIHETVAN